jgi:DNA-binding NarL/FixJ family response regulator
MPKIKILIVDDHAMLREGIRALLTLHKDIEVIGESSDGKEAVDKADELKPDIVILDIAMPGMDGLEAARRIKKKNPEIKILILTQHDNKEYILSAIKAGMSGYVPKRALASELVTAIHAVYEGNPFLYPNAASALIEDYREHVNEETDDKLTGRQREILKLIAEGHTSKAIGQMLNISLKTVQGHRAKVMEKLVIHNRTELIKYAMHKGLIALDK